TQAVVDTVERVLAAKEMAAKVNEA
ncbi:riboflavin synthase, partial [Klebsiella pneumoniae]|nr:riboflavin synthase [Klebsiella pneumoniae]